MKRHRLGYRSHFRDNFGPEYHIFEKYPGHPWWFSPTLSLSFSKLVPKKAVERLKLVGKSATKQRKVVGKNAFRPSNQQNNQVVIRPLIIEWEESRRFASRR